MKTKAIIFIFFLLGFPLIAEYQYFDVLFGINSIETSETLEGIETITVFTLVAYGDIINILKEEDVNGIPSFFLYCSETRSSYDPVKARVSIDGKIQEFQENHPGYDASFNRAVWALSDIFIKQLRECSMFAIEFNGKVYRFSKEIFIIDYHGSIWEIENPLEKIQMFLQ
jgi:hypothetical protein